MFRGTYVVSCLFGWINEQDSLSTNMAASEERVRRLSDFTEESCSVEVWNLKNEFGFIRHELIKGSRNGPV